MATKHFQQNHDYNIEKSFPCCSEHVCRGPDAPGGKITMNRHTHTRGTTTYSNANLKKLFEALKLIRIIIYILYLCKNAHH